MRRLPRKTVTLVVGGARSGKSRWAQEFAATFPRVVYIATARRGDAEMRAKIARHRRERPSSWKTVEVTTDLDAALRQEGSRADLLLVDCLTFYVANLMGRRTPERSKTQSQIEQLCERVRAIQASVVMVSNEVGSGVVPPYRSGREYRDLLGELNQQVAKIADRVILMVAGLPLAVKGSLPRLAR